MTTGLDTQLAELLAVDVSVLSRRQYAQHIVELERLRQQLTAVALERYRAFALSGAWDTDAARNPVSWLTEQTGVSRAVAAGMDRLAGYLPQMPLTAEALLEGRITESHARVLSRCVANPRVRDHFTEVEEDRLLEKAEQCTADELADLVAQWISLMDQDGTESHDPDHDVVQANRVGDRVRLNGDFGLATGLPLLAALGERSDQLFHRDKKVSEINPQDGLGMRTPGQRRAEALLDLVMTGSGAPSNPARREPLFLVHVDEETYYERLHADALLELTDGTPLPYDVMRRWRCGSRKQELVLDASRAVLYLGREERYANREIRRALAARDRGCAVPGCTVPPGHCDAHHVVFWVYGGTTDVETMILACRHHHRMIHAGKLTVEMVNGAPRFFDADGELLERSRRRPPEVHAA